MYSVFSCAFRMRVPLLISKVISLSGVIGMALAIALEMVSVRLPEMCGVRVMRSVRGWSIGFRVKAVIREWAVDVKLKW